MINLVVGRDIAYNKHSSNFVQIEVSMFSEPVKTGRKQAGRKQDGTFVKGISGNMSGRPRKIINNFTRVAIELINEQTEAITKKAIELALDGDIQAIRIIMERILPARKELPINIAIPSIKNSGDVLEVNRQILDSVAFGEITPSEGEKIMNMSDKIRMAIDTNELENRLLLLEKQFGKE